MTRHIHTISRHCARNRCYRPDILLDIPTEGVPASAWMCAKGAHQPGAMIRISSDGVVSKESEMGST